MFSPARRRVRRIALATALMVPMVATVGSSTAVHARSTQSARGCATPGLSVHLVVAGDNWFAIARSVGVSMNALLRANEAVSSDFLYPGDQLCLPEGATPTTPTAPAEPAAPATVRTSLGGDCAADRIYTVAKGDGWFVVAKRTGAGITSLLQVNGVGLDRTIHPGYTVCLPEGATVPAPAPSGGSGLVSTPSTVPGVSPGDCTSPEYQYTVASGDGWFRIATKVGTSMSSLLKVNNATVDTVLHIGRLLCLPADARPTSVRTSGVFSLDAFPIQGPCWFGDTWHDQRGNGRVHVGLDLFAPQNAYVYAVSDGTLTRQAWDQPGALSGNAWWLTDDDGTGTYYFYAHLSAFAPGLQVGSKVKAGQVIGFMGQTGSAAAPHLHLEVHPFGGDAVNPYPSLKKNGGCRNGDPYPQPDGVYPAPPTEG